MEQLTDILRAATSNVAHRYFQLPIHNSQSIYRERVYCYELYHQIRSLWPTECSLSLNGEVDKRAHPDFPGHHAPKPDFLIHEPGTMQNHAVLEVKAATASGSGIRKDLRTLTKFRSYGYERSILLVYGASADDVLQLVKDSCAGTNLQLEAVEVWGHVQAETPAVRLT
jgi:hypothetical protein